MAIKVKVIDDQVKFNTLKVNFAGVVGGLEQATFLI